MCFSDTPTNTGVRRSIIFFYIGVLSYYWRKSDTPDTSYCHTKCVGTMPQKVLGLLDIMYYISMLL
jgi:hypothetical protein